MKIKNKRLPYIFLLAFFVVLIWIVYKTDGSANLTRLNIVTQLIYTFATTVLVILTYRVLRETQSQKNLTVRPYIFVFDFNFFELGGSDGLDFKVINEGNGLALDIKIKAKNIKNKEILFSDEIPRMHVKKDDTYDALLDIRDEISAQNESSKGIMSIAPYIINVHECEVRLDGEQNEYLNLEVVAEYSDIYKKKYRNTFIIGLTDNDSYDEGYDLKESFEEL